MSAGITHESDGLMKERSSRREFVARTGKLVSALSLTGMLAPPVASAAEVHLPHTDVAGEWDLSWLTLLAKATDRAVFDWPSLGDPADPIVLEIAERYLDNCAAAYGTRKYDARIVLNIRTQAIAAALNDTMWERYSLGAEYKTTDPVSHDVAVRNPFWHKAPDPVPGISLPSLSDLVQRGAIILVCDFALGHLSKRLADRLKRDEADVHNDLRKGFIPNAFAVPSGIFGLAKSQNAGCAFVRM
jgi:hypothetical protein